MLQSVLPAWRVRRHDECLPLLPFSHLLGGVRHGDCRAAGGHGGGAGLQICARKQLNLPLTDPACPLSARWWKATRVYAFYAFPSRTQSFASNTSKPTAEDLAPPPMCSLMTRWLGCRTQKPAASRSRSPAAQAGCPARSSACFSFAFPHTLAGRHRLCCRRR